MAIPVENIYYLLCYAWNKLDEKDRVSVSIDDKTQLLDLFAKVLITSSQILLKRGIDKSYTASEKEIAGVKGKLNFGATLKHNLLLRQKTFCSFDEFSSNILLNQILVTTICRLGNTKGLDKGLRKELSMLRRMFGGIEQIELRSKLFK